MYKHAVFYRVPNFHESDNRKSLGGAHLQRLILQLVIQTESKLQSELFMRYLKEVQGAVLLTSAGIFPSCT